MLWVHNTFSRQNLLNFQLVKAFNRTGINADLGGGSHHIAKGQISLAGAPLEQGPVIARQSEIGCQEGVIHFAFSFSNFWRQVLHILHDSLDIIRSGGQIFGQSGENQHEVAGCRKLFLGSPGKRAQLLPDLRILYHNKLPRLKAKRAG
ncbi:hypothetical protein D3C75_946350 [compost metagenome]